MNIRIHQFNPTVGDLKGNAKRILEAYETAQNDKIDLFITTELALCGYPPMDLLEKRSFLQRMYGLNEELIEKSGKTGFLFGTVTEHSGKGRPVYNSAILAQHGKLVSLHHKTLLPTYDVFDDFRYFEPAKEINTVVFNGISLGISICEDLWNNENEVVYHSYERNIADELLEKGAECIINMSASPFTKKKPELRTQMLTNHARRTHLPIVYVNQSGSNTEVIFDGDSQILNSEAKVVARLPLFDEGTLDCRFENGDIHILDDVQIAELPGKDERIFKALLCGIRDYVQKTGIAKEVILGLSGGIDSALVAVLAVEALGAENVHGVMMPSMFSSEGSVNDAQKLGENLGLNLKTIPVKSLYEAYMHELTPFFEGTAFNVAEENLQSRARGMLLMALSNKFGYMLLNTGNKSEMAVGYCTLYGDMAGGVSVISDVYKTEVFSLCRWVNEHYYQKEIIPNEIITKPPSAELRPGQKDTDSLPEYDELDEILRLYIEEQLGSSDIVKHGFKEETVRKITRLVDFNEYKRRQAAPGLRISSKAFGYGRRLPIVQGWTSQESA